VLAVLLLLPAGVLCWPGPGAPLAFDLYPELAGAGYAVLLLLPAGALLLIRRAAPSVRGGLLYLGFAAVGLVSLGLRPPTDTMGADRAVMVVVAGAVALFGGASLGAAGRAWLARGLVLISILLLAPALMGAFGGAGALQNTGSTSEAALPGAAAGAWLATRGRRTFAVLGLLAVALEALFAALAPVLAGIVCLGAVLGAGLALSLPRREGRARAAGLLVTSLALFALATVATRAGPPPSEEGTAQLSEHPDLGGLEVRRRIALSVPAMIRDWGLFGTGPGQFAAAYPPYRDPVEARLSNAAVEGNETEVEHAHDDWLQGVADTGWLGGALWVGFLGLASWLAFRRMGGEPDRAALGAAAAAVLANALMRAPLSWNPAAATLGLAAIGATLARDPERAAARAPLARRVPVFVVLAALVLQVSSARTLIAHGAALARWARTGDALAIRSALTEREDSVHAWTLLARQVEPSPVPWERVLELRPHRFEALVQLGVLRARAGREDEAIQLWTHAHTLMPESAEVLHNLVRAHGMSGDAEGAAAWAERGGIARAKLTALGFDVLRERADTASAFELMELGDPALAGLTPARCWELSQEPPPGLEARARAFAGAAHLCWARQHAAQGDFAAAARSYRQARDHLAFELPGEASPRVAAPLRLEHAAALLLTGRADEARRVAEGEPGPTPRQLASLPAWAGNALLEAGLLGSG
jgi:hypothetical protein